MRTTGDVLRDRAGRSTERYRSQHNRYVRQLLQLILKILSYAHRVYSGLAVLYIDARNAVTAKPSCHMRQRRHYVIRYTPILHDAASMC